MELNLPSLARAALVSCALLVTAGCGTENGTFESGEPQATAADHGGEPLMAQAASKPKEPPAAAAAPEAAAPEAPVPNPRVVPSRGPVAGGDDPPFLFAALAKPEARRAFYTAPPVIPHALGETDQECRTCHTNRRRFQGRLSTLTPHPHWANCQQCHVRGASPKFVGVVGNVKSQWRGLPAPGLGTRQYPGAPPTIPHRIFLRENCRSCHHTLEKEPHYTSMFRDAVQCFQCHVMMDSRLDF